MSDTINAGGASDSDWFFTENGQRKGPVTTTRLLELARTEEINGDTPVWRKGLSDWQPLRTTDPGAYLQDTPPPVAPAHINNALVWTIALAPIAYALFGGMIQSYELENPFEEHPVLGFLNFFVPAGINAALCLLDERQLKLAGYADKWLTLFGIMLAPVYLFLRAKRLRQIPSYGIVWVACFILSILLSLPGGFFLR
jgi:hypothetical protein